MLPRRSGRLNADRRNRTAAKTTVGHVTSVTVLYVQSSLRLDSVSRVTVRSTHYLEQCMSMAWSVSARGLNNSLPRCVHPESIELVFYE